MGTIECSQPASKSSWDCQDFGDISMVLKMAIFASPPGHDELSYTMLVKGAPSDWMVRKMANIVQLAMPRVETRGSENEEECKQRC